MSFEVGQRVECINKDGWILGFARLDSQGPQYGDVVRVVRGDFQTLFGDCIEVSGHSGGYLAKCFRPLTEDPKRVEETMEKHFRKFLKEGVRV